MSKEAAQSNFDEAAKALADKDFSRAKDILLGFHQNGVTSADIDANLGRTYFELQDFGNAVFFLERSLSQNRLGLDIRRELQLAQAKVSAGYGQKVAHPSEWAHLIAGLVRPLEFASLASILLLIALFLKIFEHPKKRVLMVLLAATMSLGMYFFTGSNASLGLVLSDQTELKSSPLKSAKVISALPSGTRARKIRKSGDYVEIERPGQFRGWIHQDQFRALPF